MNQRIILAALLLCASPVAAQVPIAFVNVNVVPMDSERTITGQTVLVDGGRIVRVGPAGATTIPEGFRVIEGAGSFLVPGLADMHVHLLADSNELALYVANGVTTVRDLSGEPEYFDWRRDIADGSRTGPNILVGTPLIDAPRGRRVTAWLWGVTAGVTAILFLLAVPLLRRVRAPRLKVVLVPVVAVAALGAGYALTRALAPFPDTLLRSGVIPHWWVGSPREAASLVRGARGRFDAVKLYENLTPAQFGAAVRAARKAGIHSVAHVPASMGLERTLRSGVDELAHIYFLVVEMQRSTDTMANRTPELREAAYRRRMHEIAADVARSGVDVTTTLMPLPQVLEEWTDTAAFLARVPLAYVSPQGRRDIRRMMGSAPPEAAVRDIAMHIKWGGVAAGELAQAGVPLVLGTDNSPLTPVAGFGVHDELRLLVASGLTPYQVLRTATVNASRIAGASSRWGTIAAGMRADLILTSGNPLADVAALRQPSGVMVAGRWYGRAALDSLLQRVAKNRAGS